LKVQQYGRKFVQHSQENFQRILKFSLLGALSVMLLGAILGMGMPKAAHAQAYSSDNAQMTGMIHQVFGAYGDQAVRVATCESGLNPGATNTMPIGGSHAAGVFKILYPSTWGTTSQAGASPYNAAANIRAAHEIFARDGNSWREWQCKP
jgi:hypothetical protein